MQFFSSIVLSALALGSTITATPAPIGERAIITERDILAERDIGQFFSLIEGLVGNLNSGLPSLSTSISSSCSGLSGASFNTGKGQHLLHEAEDLIHHKIDLILSLFHDETSSLTNQISLLGITSTTSSLDCSAGDVAGLVTGLQSCGALIATIKAEIIAKIAEVEVLKGALDAKITAIEAAIEAIFKPLLTAALAVKTSAKVDITALISAISAFKLIVGDISAKTCSTVGSL